MDYIALYSCDTVSVAVQIIALALGATFVAYNFIWSPNPAATLLLLIVLGVAAYACLYYLGCYL